MIILKQSAAVTIPFGPFVDPTDGVSLVVSLAAAMDDGTTGIKITKNGGTLAARHATVSATAYDAYGIYKVVLDTTDTATLGMLKVIYASSATNLPVWEDCAIVTSNVWNTLHGSETISLATSVMGTESYAVDGAVPTVPQALFGILQFLMEKSISGTTMTVAKLDGSTSAMTFTLNSSTAPTSITRAT